MMLSPIHWILGAGPTHSAVLLICLLLALVASADTVLRLRRGDSPNSLMLTGALSAPLLYSVYASTLHFGSQWSSALTNSEVVIRQTLMASAIGEAVFAQIIAGVICCLSAVGLLIACSTQLSLGERPRLRLAAAGAVLTVLLTGTALMSGASTGVWEPAALRAMAYLVAGLLTTGVLLTTHVRGPGSNIGPIAALSVPLLVAGLDLAAMGLGTAHALEAIAAAAPADKQALLGQLLDTTQGGQIFSGLSIVLALLLAALGPIASWQRHREQARKHLVAMGMSLVVAATSLFLVSSYLSPFSPSSTYAEGMSQDAPAVEETP